MDETPTERDDAIRNLFMDWLAYAIRLEDEYEPEGIPELMIEAKSRAAALGIPWEPSLLYESWRQHWIP